MATKEVSTKVIIPCRFSYAHVFQPHAVEEGGPLKYGVSIIIPKSETKLLAKIEAAIELALEQGKAKLGGKVPAKWKNPLRDGDEDRSEDEAYEDCMFINANSSKKPGVVDDQIEPIIDQEEFYSGCYGRASVNFYAFNSNGNKGVAAGLNNVQKLKEGERLSGGSSAEDDFGDDDLS